MAKSVTRAEQSRASANSEPHHQKQKVQKMKDPSKSWVLTGKQFEDFRRKKEQKRIFRPFKNTQWNKQTAPECNY